jgi:hypothetical protein
VTTAQPRKVVVRLAGAGTGTGTGTGTGKIVGIFPGLDAAVNNLASWRVARAVRYVALCGLLSSRVE